MGTTKYSLITIEGTSASETCLCKKHFTKENKSIAIKRADSDIKNFEWHNVSKNDSIECIIC